MNKLPELYDPDTLDLSKQDVLDFIDAIVERWKKNKKDNLKFIAAVKLMKVGIRLQDEETIKTIWGDILDGFNRLQYENAMRKMQKQNISWADVKAKIKKEIAEGK